VKHSFKKLPSDATTDQRLDLLIAAAGKITSEDIAELTGWSRGTVGCRASKLKISLRCEEAEQQRSERRIATVSAQKLSEPCEVTLSAVDALWKIPALPKSIKRQVSNFT